MRTDPRRHAPDDIPCSFSIGFVPCGSSSHSVETMLALADEARYRARASGRNRTEQFLRWR